MSSLVNEPTWHDKTIGNIHLKNTPSLWFNHKKTLQELALTFGWHSWGTPNDDKSNAILILHPLTANTRADQWWAPLFEENGICDPNNYWIICPNYIGGCYGSIGPSDSHGSLFPKLSLTDQSKAFDELRKYLDIPVWHSVIGASLGGMAGWDYVAQFPDKISRLISIGADIKASQWVQAHNHLQRLCLLEDPCFTDKEYNPEKAGNGFAKARISAMLTYRTPQLLKDRHEDLNHVAEYLDYQGKKLVERFDPATYLLFTYLMDSQNIEQHGTFEQILERWSGSLILVSYEDDALFPINDQHVIAQTAQLYGKLTSWIRLKSYFGHDAFLAEASHLNEIINKHSKEVPYVSC